MLSGCIVCDGVGRMMVTCTGPDSVWGKAIAKLTQEYEDTPLQTKLNVMAGTLPSLFFILFFSCWYALRLLFSLHFLLSSPPFPLSPWPLLKLFS